MKRFLVLLSLLGCACQIRAVDDAVHRYLYTSTPDGAQSESASGKGILVFDIDDGFKFVRRIDNPNFTTGVRGLTGCLATHSLYYSTTGRRLGRFDLESEKVIWEQLYSGGCDRSSITLDGRKIFAPTGWWEAGDSGGFVVIDGETGSELRRIKVGKGAHNSIISLDGNRLYLGTDTTLTVFDPADEHVIQQIPDVGEFGVFPYTIDTKQRRDFVCLGKHVGFDVVDFAAGKSEERR